MSEIVVRYEPGRPRPHSVFRDGVWQSSFVQFDVARRVARSLNGGTLPYQGTREYFAMFPDRFYVWQGGDYRIERGSIQIGGDVPRYPTHTAAMTAAHKLAKGVQK